MPKNYDGLMSTTAELPLEFRVLYQSPLVSVRDCICRACRGRPEAEEYSDENSIVLEVLGRVLPALRPRRDGRPTRASR